MKTTSSCALPWGCELALPRMPVARWPGIQRFTFEQIPSRGLTVPPWKVNPIEKWSSNHHGFQGRAVKLRGCIQLIHSSLLFRLPASKNLPWVHSQALWWVSLGDFCGTCGLYIFFIHYIFFEPLGFDLLPELRWNRDQTSKTFCPLRHSKGGGMTGRWWRRCV